MGEWKLPGPGPMPGRPAMGPPAIEAPGPGPMPIRTAMGPAIGVPPRRGMPGMPGGGAACRRQQQRSAVQECQLLSGQQRMSACWAQSAHLCDTAEGWRTSVTTCMPVVSLLNVAAPGCKTMLSAHRFQEQPAPSCQSCHLKQHSSSSDAGPFNKPCIPVDWKQTCNRVQSSPAGRNCMPPMRGKLLYDPPPGGGGNPDILLLCAVREGSCLHGFSQPGCKREVIRLYESAATRRLWTTLGRVPCVFCRSAAWLVGLNDSHRQCCCLAHSMQ